MSNVRCICLACGTEVAARRINGSWLNGARPVRHRVNGLLCAGSAVEVDLLPAQARKPAGKEGR